MAKYHINPKTGNPGQCKAKKLCPFGNLTEDHYGSKEEARNAFENNREALAKPKTMKHLAIEKMMDQVLSLPLRPNVEKPVWWKDIVDVDGAPGNEIEIENNEPEILQVIDTPDGKMAIIWYNKSPSEDDVRPRDEMGIESTLTYLRKWDSGDVVGYLKLAYMSEESVDKAFSKDDLKYFRFAEYYEGTDHGFEDWGNEIHDVTKNMNGEELEEFKKTVWAGAVGDSHEKIPTWENNIEMRDKRRINAKPEHAPKDPKILAKELKIMEKKHISNLKDKMAYWETPLPAYSRILRPEENSSKGYGSLIYVATARRLGENNQMIKAATTQTDEAKKVWARFEDNEKIPTSKVTVKTSSGSGFGGDKERNFTTLDFRNKK